MTQAGAEVRAQIFVFPAPFKIVFKHTSAARDATENLIVKVTDGAIEGWGEGCPRSYVTGETQVSAVAFVTQWAPRLLAEVDDVAALRQWIDNHRDVIDRNPAAFCALELAAVDFFARRSGQSVEQALGHRDVAGAYRYSAVLSDSDAPVYAAQVLRYRFGGLKEWKLKLSGDKRRDAAKVRWFRGLPGRVFANSVRVDANNLWDEPGLAIEHLSGLDCPLVGIEEPLATTDYHALSEVASSLGAPIILDESLPAVNELAGLPGEPASWILNCRVSRVGGLHRSAEMIREASRLGMGIIVGAHVGETSLLSRAGLSAAAQAGPRLVAQEGAFGTRLLQHDVCDDPIMFGSGGVLGPGERSSIGAHGLGVEVVSSRLQPLT